MSAIDISPATALARHAKAAPDAVSIVTPSRRLTSLEVDADAASLAANLTARGVAHGDRVAHVGRNSATTLAALLACARIGAVLVPVSFRLSPLELTTVLDHCDPKAVIIATELIATASQAALQLKGINWLIDDSESPAFAYSSVPTATALPTAHALLSELPPTTPSDPQPRSFDDLAIILYTSGTSGRPKGVMLTHGNLWWSCTNMDSLLDRTHDEVNLAVAPMFHIGGLNALTLSALTRGGTVLIRPTFDPARTLEDLTTSGVTSIFGVPAMYAAIARAPGFADADLSTVRSAIVAGAPVPCPLISTFTDRGMHLQTSWGMTETAPAASCVPRSEVLRKAGTAGLPLPHNDLRIVTHEGDPISATRETGELQVRGANVTQGYWRDPETTRAAFTSDGWLRTGDLARWDDDGYVTIVGRCTDTINTGGEKVHPIEVEQALACLPGVTELAVLGVPDETWGETVAVALAGPGPLPCLDELRDVAARTIARHKLPRLAVHVPRIPRNAAGKVDRAALRRLVAQETAVENPT